MAKQTTNVLRQWFKTGLKPTQLQFWDWLDSFWHKDEKIPLTSLDGLQDAFDQLASDIGTGIDGKSVELQKTDTYIQWRLVGDANWINLVLLSDLVGDDGDDGTDGKSVELQKTATYIQWRLVGDANWINLVSLSDLKGDPGTSTEIIGYALSDQTSDIAVGVKIVDTIPYNCTLSSILLSLSEAPTGSQFQVNVKKNGTSIFSTKITIDATEVDNITAATPYVLVNTPTTFSVGDRLEISIDAVGGVTTGKGAIIKLNVIKS